MGGDAGAQRQRLTVTLFGAVALGSTALYAAYTVAPLVTAELTTASGWLGVPGASALVGTAAASAGLSRSMARRGRRLPLTAGWAMGALGAATGVAATHRASFPLLLLALFLIGAGQASNQLSRFTAAEMHPLDRRATVLGWIVWAGAIGAALGPGLLDPSAPVAVRMGLPTLAGGYLIAFVFYALASLAGALLRPDPSSQGAGDEVQVAVTAVAGLRSQLNTARVRLALVALAAAQVAMILVMTMTPVHLRGHGHGLGAVGVVMSLHLIGMFAFAPLMGRVTSRIGHGPTIAVGSGLLAIASLGAAAGGTSAPVLGAALFALGLGWCCAFVAGSALLTGGLSLAERTRLQGGVDAIVWTVSAVASLAAGFLLGGVGFAGLSLVATTIALIPAAAAFSSRRTVAQVDAA